MQVVVDSSKKYFKEVSAGVILAVMAAIWATFVRPQIVMASDLQVVSESVQRLEAKLDHTISAVDKLAQGQIRQQILYYEDQIRILEVTASERALTPTETQRLLRYKSDLSHLN